MQSFNEVPMIGLNDLGEEISHDQFIAYTAAEPSSYPSFVQRHSSLSWTERPSYLNYPASAESWRDMPHQDGFGETDKTSFLRAHDANAPVQYRSLNLEISAPASSAPNPIRAQESTYVWSEVKKAPKIKYMSTPRRKKSVTWWDAQGKNTGKEENIYLRTNISPRAKRNRGKTKNLDKERREAPIEEAKLMRTQVLANWLGVNKIIIDKMPEEKQKINPFQEVRACTDVFFLLAFIAIWIYMIILWIPAYQQENFDFFLEGWTLDYRGERCDQNEVAYHVAFAPDPDHYAFLMCAESCDITKDPALPNPYNSILISGLCTLNETNIDVFNNGYRWLQTLWKYLNVLVSAVFIALLITILQMVFIRHNSGWMVVIATLAISGSLEAIGYFVYVGLISGFNEQESTTIAIVLWTFGIFILICAVCLYDRIVISLEI